MHTLQAAKGHARGSCTRMEQSNHKMKYRAKLSTHGSWRQENRQTIMKH